MYRKSLPPSLSHGLVFINPSPTAKNVTVTLNEVGIESAALGYAMQDLYGGKTIYLGQMTEQTYHLTPWSVLMYLVYTSSWIQISVYGVKFVLDDEC